MSDKMGLDQLMSVFLQTSTRTKLSIDQLVMEVCRLAVNKRSLPTDELWRQYPWAPRFLREILDLHTLFQDAVHVCLLILKRDIVDEWSVKRHIQLLRLLNDKIKAKFISELKDTPAENSHEEIWSIVHDQGLTRNDVEKWPSTIETDEELQQHCILLRTYLDNIIVPLLREKWQMFNESSVYKPKEVCNSYFETQAPQCDMHCETQAPQCDIGYATQAPLCEMDYVTQAPHCDMDHFMESSSCPCVCHEEPLPDLLPWTAQLALVPRPLAAPLPGPLPCALQPKAAPQPLFHPEAQPHPGILRIPDLPFFQPYPHPAQETLPPSSGLSLHPVQLCPYVSPWPDLSAPLPQPLRQILPPPGFSSTPILKTNPPLPDPVFFLQPLSHALPHQFCHPPQPFPHTYLPLPEELSPSGEYSTQTRGPPPGFHTHSPLPFPVPQVSFPPPDLSSPQSLSQTFPLSLHLSSPQPLPDSFPPPLGPSPQPFPRTYPPPLCLSPPHPLPLTSPPPPDLPSPQPLPKTFPPPPDLSPPQPLSITSPPPLGLSPPQPLPQIFPPPSGQSSQPFSQTLPPPGLSACHPLSQTLPPPPGLPPPSCQLNKKVSRVVRLPAPLVQTAPASLAPVSPAREEKISREAKEARTATKVIAEGNVEDELIPGSEYPSDHNAQDNLEAAPGTSKVNYKENYISFVSHADTFTTEKCSDVQSSSEAQVAFEGTAEVDGKDKPISGSTSSSEHKSQDNLEAAQGTSESFEDHVSEDEMVPVGALPALQLPMPYIAPHDHVEDAVLSYVRNPSNFYLLLGSQVTATVEKLSEHLEEKYKDDNEPLKVWELPLGSCWAVYWTDGHWYRGKVMANIAPAPKKRAGWRVRVLLVDTGEEGEVPTRNIRVLQDIFAILPCQALPCHLVEVFPLLVWENDPWPSSSTKAFVDLCWGRKSPLKAYIHARCQDGTYGVILERSDGELVNLLMVHQGLAVSKLLGGLLEENNVDEDMVSRMLGVLKKKSLVGPNDEMIPNEWDPMSEVYKSKSNTLYHNDECAETVLLGWRNTDEERQCKYHRAGFWCPRGEGCPWEHTPVRSDVTVEKEKVLERGFITCTMPAKDSLVAVTVMSVTSPSHFYVHLHYGTKNLIGLALADQQGDTELEVLVLAMQKHFSCSSHRWQRNPALAAPGELMVLLEGKPKKPDCSRVLVLEVDDCREDACRVKVFLIDLGYEEWVSQEMLFPMPPQFAFLAPQAVECWLAGVSPPGNSWSSEAIEKFKNMVMGCHLLAYVVEVNSDYQRVGVVLHEMNNYPATCINGPFLAFLLKYEEDQSDECLVIVHQEHSDVRRRESDTESRRKPIRRIGSR